MAADHLRTGTKEYRRSSRALFVAGFMCFSMLYVTQGVLPAISRHFSVSSATASLTLSLTTLPLAFAVVVAASWSERRGRRPLLLGALFIGAALTLAAAFSPTFRVLLALRIASGVALAGLPAVAMAYLAEEVDAHSLGTAMGLYISGTGLGGMTGRLAGGLISGALSWRWSLGLLGGACLVGSLWVARRLPASQHFVRERVPLGSRSAGVGRPAYDPVLLGLYAVAFALMGSMVSFYNYLQYRLGDAPFSLSATVVPLVFLLYLFGTVSSNWMGRLTNRRSRRTVVLLGLGIMLAGILITLPAWLPTVLLGAAAITFGFFGAHSVASGWVSSWSPRRRAQVSSLYLLCYHVGSSLAGFVGGLFFERWGWSGLVGMIGFLLLVALMVVLRLPTTRGSTDQEPGELDGTDRPAVTSEQP